MPELYTEKLCVGYDSPLISDITFSVKPGSIVCMIGPNGAGKSTILKTVTDNLPAKAGRIVIGEKDINALSAAELASVMSVMMTDKRDVEYSTCFDVVSVGRYRFTGIMGRLSRTDEEAIAAALDSVGASELSDREFSRISDGQKQRVLLARALVQEPEIMVLDEPTGFLDIGYKLEFVKTLKKLVKEKNIGVLMTVHELELAAELADTVVCIKDGCVDRIGSPEEIFISDYVEKLFDIAPGDFDRVYGGFRKKRLKTSLYGTDLPVKGESKTRYLMVQGTMSGAGKSLVAAGLCRVFTQDGYRVSPFKSQNMALNSYVTEDGLEMGRAQVMQAEACRVKPSVYMNPILLKPTDSFGSQVIVNGQVVGNMRAREYFKYKKKLIPDIMTAIQRLEETSDIIVIEGAGSPAEINLKADDIVNMGMAKLVDAPVILVGDIDRGGVFAQLLGTVELLEQEERDRIKGLVVNKFRGDKTILDPGIKMLEEIGGIRVSGVLPYMELHLEDEDSLTERFVKKTEGRLRLGIIRLPFISNFTDFDVFEQIKDISICYVRSPKDIKELDICIIPGSKNTISDMKWMQEKGIAEEIKDYAASGGIVFGICGGYQMLGESIEDPEFTESGGRVSGLGLLPVRTVLQKEKSRRQVKGFFSKATGVFAGLSGKSYEGYEIHMGRTTKASEAICEFTENESGYCLGNIYGTYVHGIFDSAEAVRGIAGLIAKNKGIDIELDEVLDYRTLKEKEYDILADTMRKYMDIDYLYEIMGVKGE